MPTPRRSRLSRWLSWIVAIPVAVAIVLFVASNRTDVPLSLYPLPPTLVSVPVYAVGLGGLFAGFLCGGYIAWRSGHRWRRRAREESRARLQASAENAALKRRLAATEQAAEPASEAPAAPPMRLSRPR